MITFFNAVNTYTDASIVTDRDGRFISCAGYITVFHGEVIDSGTKIVYNTTNNYGEILAIYMGIQSLLSFKEYDTFLNLFSDSKISIMGLREWIYGWLRNSGSNENFLVNSNGNLVSNQEIFCNIINYIVQNNTHLSLYHQKGHKDPSNVRDMEEVRKCFLQSNNVLLSDDIIREICYYNNMVDRMTRNVLKQTTSKPGFHPDNYKKPWYVARRVLNWDMMGEYKKLIEGEKYNYGKH